MAAAENLSSDVLKWSSSAVLVKLQAEGFDPSVIDAFEREAIDGESLMALTTEDLREMNLRLGHKKKIELLICSLKQNSVASGTLLESIVSTPHQVDQVAGSAPHQVTGSAPLQVAATTPIQVAVNTPHGVVADTTHQVAGVTPTRVLQISRRSNIPLKHTFDVIKMVTSSDTGKAIYDDYLEREDHMLSVPERRTLVSIIAQALVAECGVFPTTDEKNSLAEGFVAAFPTLGIKEGDQVIHSHYFDPKSGGFLENAIKRIRRGMPDCRKRKRNQQQRPHKKIPPGIVEGTKEDFVPEEVERLEFKIRFLKSLPPTSSNLRQISDEMEATYWFRQFQMKSKLTSPSLIFAEYPRMVDSNNGRLIFDDFMRKYPKAQDVEHGFINKYGRKIQRLAEVEGVDVPACNDDFLRMLFICILTMPEIKKVKRSSNDSKMQQLALFLPANEDMEEFVKNRNIAQRKNNKQPYLLCSGTMKDPLFFNVVIEDTIIPAGITSVQAFSVLFASFFVFQLHYPVLIKPLFKLFEERVFLISKWMSATTTEFISLLESPKCC